VSGFYDNDDDPHPAADAGAEQEAAGAQAMAEPQNRQELQDLKDEFPTSAHLVSALYHDHMHKLKCIIMCEGPRPLHAAFIRDDAKLAESQAAQEEWAAGRAECSWRCS
jgi:hypothetical protein